MSVWKSSPNFRFGLRTLVIALLVYGLAAAKEGITDWRSFAGGGIIAAAYAILGLLTPIEPFAGVNKPTGVEVPTANARLVGSLGGSSPNRTTLGRTEDRLARLLPPLDTIDSERAPGIRYVHREDEPL